MENKKEMIINILKREGELPTSKISVLISTNYYLTEIYLKDLLDLNYVKKISKGKSVYWKLNKRGKNE